MKNDTDIQRERERDTFSSSSTQSNTSTQEKTNEEEKNEIVIHFSYKRYFLTSIEMRFLTSNRKAHVSLRIFSCCS
jgi:hypothetical protein